MTVQDLLTGVFNNKERFLKSNYPEIYDSLIEYCRDISDLSFKQKIWHYDNKVPTYVLCGCGKFVKFNKDWFSGYRKFCSPKCANNDEDSKKKKTLCDRKHYDTKDFIAKSKIIHNNKFDYSKTEYKGSNVKVVIVCPKHGEFEQLAFCHLQGKDCRKCHFDKKKKGLSYFIEKSNDVHKNKYDYSISNLENFDGKVWIICPDHGIFEQRCKDHLAGRGCPRCNLVISKREVYWLDLLKIPKEYRHKTLIIGDKRYNVDAYDPNTRTIYEFYGDYWHGNPKLYEGSKLNPSVNKTFGDLYNLTIKRENDLKLLGFNLSVIWEFDFDLKYDYLN